MKLGLNGVSNLLHRGIVAGPTPIDRYGQQAAKGHKTVGEVGRN